MPLHKMRCLGVFRELQNSPNRETDDELILKAVIEQVGLHGVQTQLAAPEEFDSMELSRWDLVLPMCEAYPRLMRLQSEKTRETPLLLNPPQAVLNCYRTKMVPLLSGSSRLDFPPSEIRQVEKGAGDPPSDFNAPKGWWIKRGDVHNTCSHDVVFVRQWEEMNQVLEDFQSREIAHYVIQPHIPGDLIKFYGVGPGRWFTWFYHDPANAQRLPFALEDLAQSAAEAASMVGLEIFGGDAIISPDKKITVIDINSWPSFARVRKEASVQIAAHLRDRLCAIA